MVERSTSFRASPARTTRALSRMGAWLAGTMLAGSALAQSVVPAPAAPAVPASAAAASAAPTSAAAQPRAAVVLKPESGPLAAQGSFGFGGKADKVRRSLSGIACPVRTGTTAHCLVAFDEGNEVRTVTLDGDDYRLSSTPIRLGEKGTEIDAEGVASDGRGYLYVTGSHARTRGDCKNNPASRQVWRIPYDGREGLSARALAGAPIESSRAAWRAMRRVADLGAARCPGRGGLNVEGLAWFDGRLVLGLRQGTAQGRVRWLAFDAEALFTGEEVSMHVHTAPLGRGLGVRDLATVADGVLMLIGPDDDPGNADQPWRIVLWALRGEPLVTELATLALPAVPADGCSRRIKPEAMAVLDESPQHYRIAVLSDGLCDGGPMRFTVPRGH
ncbi:MAG: DUF3616 domain-containing protein [Burkholderiaceae bacterium]